MQKLAEVNNRCKKKTCIHRIYIVPDVVYLRKSQQEFTVPKAAGYILHGLMGYQWQKHVWSQWLEFL